MSSHQFTVQFIQFIVCCNLSCCYSNKHRHVIYVTALQLCCFVEFCVLKSGDDFSSLHCLPSVRRRPDAVDGLNCTDLGKALSTVGLFDPVDCRGFVGFVACTIFDGRGGSIAFLYRIPPFDSPRCRWESFAFRKTTVSATVFESVVRIEDSLYVTMTYVCLGDFTHAYACHPALHIHSRMRLRRRLPNRGRAWAGWGWGAICIPPSPQKGLFWPVNHHRLKRFVCVLCSPPTAYTMPTID